MCHQLDENSEPQRLMTLRQCVKCNSSFTLCQRHGATAPHALSDQCLRCASLEQLLLPRTPEYKECSNCHWQIRSTEREVKCLMCSTSLHSTCDPNRRRICNSCQLCNGLMPCVACHERIQLCDMAMCMQCNRPTHSRTCLFEGRCSQCYINSRCSCCKDNIEQGHATLCVTCGNRCHVRCTTDSKCTSCFHEFSQRVPALHKLPDMHLCRFCTARQFTNSRTFCCGKGEHVLSPDITEEPPDLFEFFYDHQHLLITHGREINQLASFMSIGVKSQASSFGGIQYRRGEECFASIEGKIYHFPLFHGGNRSHPLLGNAASFLFHETGPIQSFNERFTPAVVEAALQLRNIMEQKNRHVHSLREQYGHVDVMEFTDFLRQCPEHRVTVAGDFENSATSSGQLTLLYSLSQSVFSRPEIRASPHNTNHNIPWWDQRYESMTYPLFDVYGTHGWFINRDSVTRAGEPEDPLSQFRDAAGNKLTLRQYIQYNFSQNRLHLMAPRLQQEWLLDQISRAIDMFCHYRHTR